jgi:curved DNA-binding protein CbpA
MAERDPYQVLGVPSTASDDEIKKAYRELVRKYHPDKYQDSDLKDLASEKMKEVNAAYEAIQQMRAGGNSSGGYSSNGYSSGNGQQYSSYSTNPLYAEIRRLINAGNIGLAEQKLHAVSEGDRGAEWNFLKACVLVQRGHFFDAQKHEWVAEKGKFSALVGSASDKILASVDFELK